MKGNFDLSISHCTIMITVIPGSKISLRQLVTALTRVCVQTTITMSAGHSLDMCLCSDYQQKLLTGRSGYTCNRRNSINLHMS
jgi:hypothetical protein